MYVDFVEDVTDEQLNNLLVDMNTFANIACMGARAFGVHTDCDPCDIDINLCLKKHLVNNLLTAQGMVERRLGYLLTPQYHTTIFVWDQTWPIGRSRPFRVQVDYPGVSKINVQQEYTELPNLSAVPIQYAIQASVDMSPSDDNCFCIAELDASVIDNPAKVLLQDGTGKVFKQTEVRGFPRINQDGNWEIAVDRSNDPTTCPENPSAYHCNLAYADITPPTCEGEIVPVYPGTRQHIPLAKPVETLSNGDRRYWFNVWELVKPAFHDEIVSISSGEYYKLLQTISFLCVSETEVLPVVTCKKGCNCGNLRESEVVPQVQIIDAGHGVLEVCFNAPPCGCNVPETVRILYKTDPQYLPFPFHTTALKEAIAYWTAANLPLDTCDCRVEKGFIAEAQKAYTENRSSISGEIVSNFEYGDLHGQMVLAERLQNVPKFDKFLRV